MSTESLELWTQTHADPTQDRVTRNVYDDGGRLTKVVQSYYDENSKQVRELTEEYGYDSHGNKVLYTNQKGVTWRYGYDDNNRLKWERSPLAKAWKRAELKNSSTNQAEVQQAVTWFDYDGNGNVKRQIEGLLFIGGDADPSNLSNYVVADARTTEFEYDAANNLKLTRLPGQYGETNYEGQYRPSGTAPGNRARQVFYDHYGYPGTQIDENDVTTYKAWDGKDRLRFEIDGEGNVTEYYYDGKSKVVEIRYEQKIPPVLLVRNKY